jgi:hypothetical protein
MKKVYSRDRLRAQFSLFPISKLQHQAPSQSEGGLGGLRVGSTALEQEENQMFAPFPAERLTLYRSTLFNHSGV